MKLLGSSQSQKSTITTVDCASIDSGLALINSYISKKVNLSHCKAIIISEELAYNGISEYIYNLTNNIEIRPDCNVIISRCNAEDFLKNSTPTLETVSARYYEFILNSSEYTGYTENVSLSDFYSAMISTTTEAHGILGGINEKSTHNLDENLSLADREASYKAGETPIQTNTGVEIMGIAVFNEDKLVGELTGMESLCHLIVTNKFKTATISIPDPLENNSIISLFVHAKRKPEISAKLINGTPYINCKISLSADILSLDNTSNYSTQDALNLISNYANSYLEKDISSYLYKMSKEYNSDIDNFGKYIIKNYTTWDEWIKSDWLSNFKNSFFTVQVDTNIVNGQLYNKI